MIIQLAIALLLTGAPVGTIVTAPPVIQDEKEVRLSRTFKKGDSARHKAESEITTGMGDAKLVGTSRTTVKDVKENGQIVMEETTESGKLTLNGMEIDIPISPPTVVIRDRSGRLVEMKREETPAGQDSPEIAKLMASIGTPILLDKPVKPGETWETEVDNPAVKGKKIKVKTTFVSIEKVEGADCWKLKQSTEAPTDAAGGKLTYDGVYWLDSANGHEAKAEVIVKDLPSQFGVLNLKTKAIRLKPVVLPDK